jgi:hypothetical protein
MTNRSESRAKGSTREERTQEYFFMMSFRDRAQCDRAVDYIMPHKDPVESIPSAVYSMITNQVFTCWEDL